MQSTMIRAFIAIELPTEIRSQLGDVISRLKTARTSGIRWVAATNIHLTLKFLGDTQPASITKLKELLQSVSANHPPMDLVVSGLGAFPNSKQPRVIWIGVEIPPQIHAMHKAIEIAAERIGCPPEGRRFSPHLTLGRVQKNASRADMESITNALSTVKVGELGRFQASTFTLFQSELHPTGSVYTPLAHFNLTCNQVS